MSRQYRSTLCTKLQTCISWTTIIFQCVEAACECDLFAFSVYRNQYCHTDLQAVCLLNENHFQPRQSRTLSVVRFWPGNILASHKGFLIFNKKTLWVLTLTQGRAKRWQKGSKFARELYLAFANKTLSQQPACMLIWPIALNIQKNALQCMNLKNGLLS